MKRYTLLLVLVLIVAFATSAVAQKYAILKPAKQGAKSEAIPISKKQLDQMLKGNSNTMPVFNATHMGVIDTIGNTANADDWDTNWGVAVGDTNAAYFEPAAACYIKAIGVVGQTWSTSPLASGFNLMINKPAHPWVFPTEKWAGDGCYVTDSLGYATLLGEKMWGDFPASVVDGERVWTEMIFLGYEPDSEGEGFVVSVVPFGDGYCGVDSKAYTAADDTPRLAKFYGAGRSGYDPQFVIRHYQVAWRLVVEFYENTPPSIVAETYSTVLSAGAKTLEAHVTDIDANDPAQAGAATVNCYYQVNDGAVVTLAATMTGGSDTDGTWAVELPADYMMAGDVLTFWWDATDKAGMMSESAPGSFSFFQKSTELLVFYNDDGTSYPSWILTPYYDNLWVDANDVAIPYDVWVGLADGPLSAELVTDFDNMVIIDAYSPATMNEDVLGAWMAAGPKNLLFSSQEYAGALIGNWSDDTTFAADDWHNMYLGLETIGGAGHDIAADPFPVVPVAGDEISGGLAEFLGDSLTLYIQSDFELGFTNWGDAFVGNANAVVCFTDSAEGRTMGIHNANAGYKTVFLGFDPLTLDAGVGPTAAYWTEPNVSSVIGSALTWFGVSSDVEETTPGVVSEYNLSQNYPNPFNPETKITYSISQPGLVKLSVYNVLGQKIADLVNEHKAPATYHVSWNAKDVASGVYFYRIEAGDYTKTMKMMLLR